MSLSRLRGHSYMPNALSLSHEKHENSRDWGHMADKQGKRSKENKEEGG